MERAINIKETQAKFLIIQIKAGKITYQECITNRPDLKEELDKQLIEQGLGDLIVPTEQVQA